MSDTRSIGPLHSSCKSLRWITYQARAVEHSLATVMGNRLPERLTVFSSHRFHLMQTAEMDLPVLRKAGENIYRN
jgi:hypothetical protein